MKVGDRIRIKIKEPDKFTADAMRVLDDQVGVIGEVKQLAGERSIRVDFDPPLAPHWKWGSPTSGFWFEPSDLEPIP